MTLTPSILPLYPILVFTAFSSPIRYSLKDSNGSLAHNNDHRIES